MLAGFGFGDGTDFAFTGVLPSSTSLSSKCLSLFKTRVPSTSRLAGALGGLGTLHGWGSFGWHGALGGLLKAVLASGV